MLVRLNSLKLCSDSVFILLNGFDTLQCSCGVVHRAVSDESVILPSRSTCNKLSAMRFAVPVGKK